MKQRISLGCFPQNRETKYLLNFIEEFNATNSSSEIVPQFLDEEEILRATSPDLLLPDIITIYSSDIALLSQSGLIIPTSFIFSPGEMEDIYPAVLSSVKWKGEIWGVPLLEGNPWCILYNHSLFQQAGIKEAPKSWSEILNFAEKMTKDKDKDGLIDQWGLSLSYATVYLFIWQNEGDILDETGGIVFNEEKVVEALNYLIKLKKYLSPHQDRERKDTGMIYTREIDVDREGIFSGEISFIPGNLKRVNSFGGEKGVLCFSVIKKDKSMLEGASEFLRWWKKDENYLRWCLVTSLVPFKKSIAESDTYQQYLEEKPYLRTQLSEVDFCRVVSNFPGIKEIQKILVQIIDEVEDEGEKTKEKIKNRLKAAEHSAAQIISRYLKDEK